MTAELCLITFVVFVLQFLSGVSADTCFDGSRCSGSRYCCRSQSYSSRYKCCTRVTYHFWAQWYLWVAFVIFFILLFSCLMAYRRRQRNRMLQSRTGAMVITTTTNQQAQYPRGPAAPQPTTYPPPMMNQPMVQSPDAPPTYDQIAQQGAMPQPGDYSKNYYLPTGAAPEYKDPNYPPYPMQPPMNTPQSTDPPAPPYPGN